MRKLLNILVVINIIWTSLLCAILFFSKPYEISERDLNFFREIESNIKYLPNKYFRINQNELEILNTSPDGSVDFTSSKKLLLKNTTPLSSKLGFIEKSKSGIWIHKRGLPASDPEGYFIGRSLSVDELDKVKYFMWECPEIYTFRLK